MVYSQSLNKQKNVGWFRGGNKIMYYRNNIPRTNDRYFSTLSFTYEFTRENDQTYFAYNQPYTYSELQSYLEGLEANPQNAKIFSRKLLTRTLAGNRVDLITITKALDISV